MQITRWNTSPRYERDGIISYLLASSVTTDAVHLTTTLVEVRPGGMQRMHHHDNEQCYFILEGQGIMTVEDEVARVKPGDCIFIPTNTPHGLVNDGEETLTYFSAASPSFGEGVLKDWMPLGTEMEGPIGEEEPDH